MSTDQSGFDQYQRTQIQGVSSVNDSTPTNIHVDPITNELLVKSTIDDSLPPTSGNNPSLVISETTVGTETTTVIQKTIGATTYQQTVVEDSSDNSTTISTWSTV